MPRSVTLLALTALLLLAGTAAPALAQDESSNTAKSEERAAEHQTPAYQADLQQRSAENATEGARIQATDPERQIVGNLCWSLASGCAGDVRLYDFEKRGRGLVTPVLFTARNGATISGHVWATKAGPAKRPAVVITNGSIQASEQLYWWAAQTLAKAGYVVITSDPQGQARSDNVGEGADANEGVHSQVAGNTFYDGTQDALDFLLSSPQAPFCARPSRSGTSHCAKQQRRVAASRNAAYNPYHDLVDRERIGIAGHSYGASGVSWVAQQDKRVDAVVAWDALCDPSTTDGDSDSACSRGGQGGPVALRVPSLDLTADYFMGRESKRTPPEPTEKSAASRAFSKAGIDTGSIVIRGGTHFEFSYLPTTSFRATLRGIDLSAWYTLAWLDRYVKGDPTAERRLLTSRWRTDPGDREVDPKGAGNLFSYHYRSRLDVGHDGGERFVCEDLRKGCEGQPGDDGEAARWGYFAIASSPDGTPAYTGADAGSTGSADRAPGTRACTSRRAFRVTARRVRGGGRITQVVASVGRRRVGTARGRRVRIDLRGLPAGRAVVTLRVRAVRGGRAVRVTQRRTFRLCVPRG